MDATAETSVFENVERYISPAATGKRFANYLIDAVLYYGVYLGCMYAFGIIWALSGGTSASIRESMDSLPGKVLLYLSAVAINILFYTVIEAASKGRSLGKLITGTRAVRENGDRITFRDALLRSLCRIIPFETFSGLSGHPWHDTITHTVVTDTKNLF